MNIRAIRIAFISSLALFWVAHSSASTAACDYDACVSKTLVGERYYRSVGTAISAGHGHRQTAWEVHIEAGEYREKLVVDVPGVHLIGARRDATVLHYDAYAGQQKPGSQDQWGTWESATLIIRAPDFKAKNLTIANRFDFLTNDALPKDHPDKVRGAQAVAVMTDRGSDRSHFDNVAIEGYQDTLFLLAGRSLIEDSLVSGNVDFIFGAGTGLFIDSEIRMRRRGQPHQPMGYLTAPSTDIDNRYGLVFLNCRLTREPGVPDDSTSLGRPWHPTTTFPDGRYADPDAIGAAVFLNTWMDAHISSAGWSSMGGTAPDGGRIEFQPEDARFFEYQSRGPGANASPGRRQLSREQATQYHPRQVLGDWKLRLAHPLPNEYPPYTPENELAKHQSHWPGISLASATLPAGVREDRDQVYARDGERQLQADVFLPAAAGSARRPGVILVHGGGWRSGSRGHLVPLAQQLAARGYVAATVEYRLSREALYPAAVLDLERALHWLRGQADAYQLDPQRIAILGTSAGAHLATLVGATNTVQAIVNIDGVVDLVSEEARRHEDSPAKPSAFGLWIGGRYADYPALWREASPLEYVDRDTPPTLFLNSAQPRFHVGRDAFMAQLREFGIATETHTIPATPHTFWLFEPWFGPTVERVASFLGRILAPAQSSGNR